MTPADLDALAALVGRIYEHPDFALDKGIILYGAPLALETDVNAVLNAAPDLLRLARKGLEADAEAKAADQHALNQANERIQGGAW